MLPNVDRKLYARFKRGGYRKRTPVLSVDDIVHLGYLDVCRTMRGIDEEQREAYKKPVKSLIDGLRDKSPETQDGFDWLHRRCCEESISASSDIRYGHAQKLLNMSLKYLYNEFAASYGEANPLNFPDNNVEWLFHLPIDKQIRTYLVNDCKFDDPSSLPWSQWSYDNYWKFQSELRNRITGCYKPLEIDYMLWNTEAANLQEAIKAPR